jgi:hypothetical protein
LILVVIYIGQNYFQFFHGPNPTKCTNIGVPLVPSRRMPHTTMAFTTTINTLSKATTIVYNTPFFNNNGCTTKFPIGCNVQISSHTLWRWGHGSVICRIYKRFIRQTYGHGFESNYSFSIANNNL